MSWVYHKEIIDGVKSCRKICGITVYSREDFGTNVVRKYFAGFFKTVTMGNQKEFYFCGKKVRTKFDKNTIAKRIDNLYAILKRVLNETSNTKIIVQSQELHKKNFAPYKNIFREKTVVLVGPGKAAEDHQYVKDAIYVGVDEVFLQNNISLNYFFCEKILREHLEELIEFASTDCEKFVAIRNSEVTKNRFVSKEQLIKIPKYVIDKMSAKEFYVYDTHTETIAYDIQNEPLFSKGTIYAALQFILHCHPKQIYLVLGNGEDINDSINQIEYKEIEFWRMFKVYIDELYPDVNFVAFEAKELRGVFANEEPIEN